ncbi:MAG: LysR family transcriptional regulator [Pseudomonadota bacterium]|nr:LysR family transcriptional regulator [Pseudomonadota bacterium]
MNSSELKTFITVAQASSISHAARQLHLTQPAVSKRIQGLENHLGTSLFDRVGKRLHLTQAGKLLKPEAELLLSHWTDTERRLRSLSEEVTGTLNIATSHHVGLHRLAPVLTAFRQAYPDVRLNIAFEDSEIAHMMMRQGDIELAVATLDPDGSDDLQVEPIWDDPLVFVDDRPGTTSLDALAQRPCVLPGTGTYTGRIVLHRFAQVGIDLEPTMSTNYLETLSMLVSVGLGWSVLPVSMSAKVFQLDVHTQPMARTLGVITNPQRAMTNGARAFLEILKSYADVEPPT